MNRSLLLAIAVSLIALGGCAPQTLCYTGKDWESPTEQALDYYAPSFYGSSVPVKGDVKI